MELGVFTRIENGNKLGAINRLPDPDCKKAFFLEVGDIIGYVNLEALYRADITEEELTERIKDVFNTLESAQEVACSMEGDCLNFTLM